MTDATQPRDLVSAPGYADGVRQLTCPRCGSHHLHRPRSRNMVESAVRALTPLRFHRCSDCGQRGHHWIWSAPRAAHPQEQARPGPAESRGALRDTLAERIRRRRIIGSILVATALGVLAAVAALSR